MSDVETIRSAESKGIKAFWDGIPYSKNPYKGGETRLAWFNAWSYESKLKSQSDTSISKLVNDA